MTLKPEAEKPHKAISKKNLLWAIPLLLALAFIAAVLALPGFVSSSYHRATIEALASSLTGRTVHIHGKLSLALLPQPQFIAGDITITSPENEVITAASLTLVIAPIALLHGQISARTIMLQSPHIVLPWPLPGGAAAIAPPPWLTTLHAQINNGQISLGAAEFTHVSADIFTGGQGTFSISGNGNLGGAPITLSLSFGALSAVGSTPIALDIQTNNAAKLQAHISGSFDASSTLTGNASFSAATLSRLDPGLSQPLSGTATITADPQQILLSNLTMQQGDATLAGTATINLPHPALSLLLTGKNLTLPPASFHASPGFPPIPTHLTLDAANTTLATHPAFVIAHLRTSLDFDATGTRISAFTLSLPDAELSLTGALDPAGNLQAKSLFSSTDLNSLIGGANPALPAAWQETSLKFVLAGTTDHLMLNQLSGNFGPAEVTGSAVLTERGSLMGQLHFDQLDLTPFIALLRHPPHALASAWSGDFEITADHASIDKIPLAHLLADASLGNQLTVRRLSASLYGGIAAASFTLAEGAPSSAKPGQASPARITSARAILSLPSAAPVAALLPAAWRPPLALTKAPLAFSFLAAGPANALATSASLNLGEIAVTAAPVVNLIDQTANGAFTLRHPDAIAAFKAFGLNAGLPWPGAGSIALRANLSLSPAQMGFSDFVLSMGDLTANGALIYGNHQLNGQIDADTLALPPIPASFTPPWADLANIQGKIAISANRVLVAGDHILGPANANITLTPGKFDLALAQAAFAQGKLNGDFSATLAAPTPPDPGKPAPPAPPAIIAKFTLTGADATAFNVPPIFPLTLPSGTISAAIDLAASGYTPSVWLATLAGNASLAAESGSMNGFNLPALTAALHAPARYASHLRTACLTGVTPFTSLNLTSSVASGIVTLNSASLQSPSGTGAATGNIDLPDTGLTLTLTLQPAVPAPPKLTLTLDGNWPAPRKIAAVKQALSWKP